MSPTRRAFLLTLALPAFGAAAQFHDSLALVQAARTQIGVTLRYDPAYTRLAYPGGDGLPLVLHNIGLGTREEDFLFGAAITGHYRFAP